MMTDMETIENPTPGQQPSKYPPGTPWWAILLIDFMDKHAVENWRDAKRWMSLWFPAICGAAIEVGGAYSEQILAHLPASWVPHIIALAFWACMGARFVKQIKKEQQP